VGDELQSDTVSEINVTPMIDVLLSLLIIFMVAAKPPPNHKQPIAIPQDPIEQTENDPDATLLVVIDEAGAVSIGKTPVEGGRPGLIAALLASEKAQTDSRVAIKADNAVPYGSVIDVMSAAREAGIQNVGIASERL